MKTITEYRRLDSGKKEKVRHHAAVLHHAESRHIRPRRWHPRRPASGAIVAPRQAGVQPAHAHARVLTAPFQVVTKVKTVVVKRLESDEVRRRRVRHWHLRSCPVPVVCSSCLCLTPLRTFRSCRGSVTPRWARRTSQSSPWTRCGMFLSCAACSCRVRRVRVVCVAGDPSSRPRGLRVGLATDRGRKGGQKLRC